MYFTGRLLKNENIDIEESHGCIHVTPKDIDTLISKGYFKTGTKIFIHGYDEDIPKEWIYDSTGEGPFEVHFFPGKKRMLITGEK